MGKKNKNKKKTVAKDDGQLMQQAFIEGDLALIQKKITKNNIQNRLQFKLYNRKFKGFLGLKLDIVNHEASPLYWAALFSCSKIIYYLLSIGADITETVTMQIKLFPIQKKAALYEHIVQRCGKECVEPILAINKAWVPLIIGTYIRHKQHVVSDADVYNWLERYQPSLPDGGYCFLDTEKKSLLAMLLMKNFVNSFSWVCQRLDNDKWPYYCDKQKLQLAHAAVFVGHVRILSVIVQYSRGREICLEKNTKGQTPLAMARNLNNADLIELLERVERDESVDIISADIDNMSLKKLLELRNYNELGNYFKKHPDIINKNSIEFTYGEKRIQVTPLYYAVMMSMPSVVVWLVGHGANMVGHDVNTLAPFFFAVQVNDLAMLNLLIELNAGVVNEPDECGDSVFFFATRQLAHQSVKFLIQDCGLDPFAISKKTGVSCLTESILLLSVEYERKRHEMMRWLWSLYQKPEHFNEFNTVINNPLYAALNAGKIELAFEMVKRMKSLGLLLPYMFINRFLVSDNIDVINQLAPLIIGSQFNLPGLEILVQLNAVEVELISLWKETQRMIKDTKRFNAALCILLLTSEFELQKHALLYQIDFSKPVAMKSDGQLYFIDIFVLQKRIDLVEKALEQGGELTGHACFDSGDKHTPLQYIEQNYKEQEWQALVKRYGDELSDSSEPDENTDPLLAKKEVELASPSKDSEAALCEVVKRSCRVELKSASESSLFQPVKPTWFNGALAEDAVDVISKKTNTYFLIAAGLLNGPDAEKIKSCFAGRSVYFNKKCLHKMVMDDDIYYKIYDQNKKYKFTHEMVKRGIKDRLVIIKVKADNGSASLFLAVDYAADGFHLPKHLTVLRSKKRMLSLSFIVGDSMKSISSLVLGQSNTLP